MHFLFLYRLKFRDVTLGKQTAVSEYGLQLLGLKLSLFSSGFFLDRMREEMFYQEGTWKLGYKLQFWKLPFQNQKQVNQSENASVGPGEKSLNFLRTASNFWGLLIQIGGRVCSGHSIYNLFLTSPVLLKSWCKRLEGFCPWLSIYSTWRCWFCSLKKSIIELF